MFFGVYPKHPFTGTSLLGWFILCTPYLHDTYNGISDRWSYSRYK